MELIKRIIVALTVLIIAIAAPALGRDADTPSDFYVPPTVSEAAGDLIRSFSQKQKEALTAPASGDRSGWRKQWQAFEGAFLPRAEAAIAKYQPSIREMQLGGVPILEVTPKTYRESGKILVYAHGGGYGFLSAKSTLGAVVPLADETGLRIISLDYTRAPFARYETVTDQAIAVIESLIARGYSLQDIALYGDSAGGGLVAGTVLKMRDRGLGMPAAVVLWSPWTDVTETGDTYQTLKAAEPLYFYDRLLKPLADAYAPPEEQKHPYVSPVYGDYKPGFPPTLIQGGTKELLLSNFVRLYQALDRAGQTVKLDLYEGMLHVFQQYDIPEAQIARQKVADFLKQYLLE